ncbi:MAG: glycosyltransferase family 2 protein [Candidatus Syntropharchaeia archaeon]
MERLHRIVEKKDRIGYTTSTLLLLFFGAIFGKMLYYSMITDFLKIIFILLTTSSFYHVYKFFRVENPPKIKEYKSVSLIVPAYKEESVLEECIDHLLRVDYPKELLEIIIVYEPDCDDKTGEIAKRIAREHEIVRAFCNDGEYRGTKAGALNLAVTRAKGEIIGVYDADHCVEPDVVKRAVSWFNSIPNLGAVDGRCSIRNKNCGISARLAGSEFSTGLDLLRYVEDRITKNHFVYGSNFFIKKDVLKMVGGFDDRVLGEDKEMGMRLIRHGYKIKLDLGMVSWEQVAVCFSDWWEQRKRWDRGRFQILSKYFPHIKKEGLLKSELKRAFPLLLAQAVSYPIALIVLGALLISVYIALSNLLLYLYMFTPLIMIFVLRSWQEYKKGKAELKDVLISFIVPFYLYTRAFIGFKALWEELVGKERTWKKVSRI